MENNVCMDTKTILSDYGETRSELVMQASLALLQPLIRFLVEEGVTYPSFAKALKDNFVDAATDVLEERGSKITDSALSVLSGVHRKDLRSRNDQTDKPESKPLSVISEIFTRWAVAPEYKTADGQVMALPKSGDVPNFETLVAQITRDIHPRSVLDSMLQLGVVVMQGDLIALSPAGFVPNASQKELLSLFADNLRDHIHSGTTNLSQESPKFLEHSVFADELTNESARSLHKTAVALWRDAFNQFAQQAGSLSDADKDKADADHRIRFGVYFFAEPEKHNKSRRES